MSATPKALTSSWGEVWEVLGDEPQEPGRALSSGSARKTGCQQHGFLNWAQGTSRHVLGCERSPRRQNTCKHCALCFSNSLHLWVA